MPKIRQKLKPKASLANLKRLKFKPSLLAVIVAAVVLSSGYLFYNGTHAAIDPWVSVTKQYSCPLTIYGEPATVKYGSTGNCVRMLQYILRDFAGQKLAIDGSFGNDTFAAVVNVQKFMGDSPADGTVDYGTWNVMKVVYVTGIGHFSGHYFANSQGIDHATGSYIPDTKEIFFDGSRNSVITWRWSSAHGDSKTSWLQFGPYSTLSVPYGNHGFHVCHLYSLDNGLKPDQYSNYYYNYANLYMDVVYNNTGTRVRQYLTSTEPRIDGLTSDGYKRLRFFCFNVPFNFGTYKNLEFRLKLTWTDGHNVSLNLYETTVDPY